MIIGGLQKLSLLDYPGLLSAIIFTKGCNFRCRYCYNPMFVLPNGEATQNKPADQPLITTADLLVFLKSRIGKLDAVVITGGEPTLHADLPDLIRAIKELGFLVKLDTNGTNPEMLKTLIDAKLIDYLAMDVKAPLGQYQKIMGFEPDYKKIQKSVKLIMESNLPYEFRTTVHQSLLSANDILTLANDLQGANKWFLQAFIGEAELLDPTLAKQGGYSLKDLQTIASQAAEISGACQVRTY